ncbi:hypothetical protein HK102_006031, partial [Quaeritorhiza haematococci]
AKKQAVAFEIPLDDLVASSENTLNNADRSTSAKVSLPKLHLTPHDLQAKLANTEARWKDLEQEQADRVAAKRRKNKPPLSKKRESDPTLLKRKLLEKEAHAAQNRAREMSKLQAKLARQEQHARRVQERKRALGKGSNEHLNVSWGGENDGGLSDLDLAMAAVTLRRESTSSIGAKNTAGANNNNNKHSFVLGGQVVPNVYGSGVGVRSFAGKMISDVDSGKGSSSASLSFGNESRRGSGRSNVTANIDLAEDSDPISAVISKAVLERTSALVQ